VASDPINWTDPTGEIAGAVVTVGLVILFLYVADGAINNFSEGRADLQKNQFAEARYGKGTMTPEQIKLAENKVDSLQSIKPFSDLANSVPGSLDGKTYVLTEASKITGENIIPVLTPFYEYMKEFYEKHCD
jgi:hypothetical protein